MEIFKRKLPSFETFARVLANLRLSEEEKQPLAMAYYFTFNCNAGCWFCSQRENLNNVEEPDLEHQLEVLRVVREGCPNVYLMGGEPTMSSHLGEILEECGRLKFDTIGINTNALKYEPKILEYANMLVVSLSSMDSLRVGEMFGLSEVDGQRAISNIRKYAEEKGEGVEMVVNVVVTGDNINDVYQVANYCSDLGVSLNVAPAIMPNGRPDKRLLESEEYRDLIDDLIADSRLMACSIQYLETIRDFKDFECVPNVIPGVFPNGDVVVPCQGVQNPKMVNLLEEGGVSEALQVGRAEFGEFVPAEECADRCHKTCYIEGARMSTREGVVSVFGGIFRKRVKPWEVGVEAEEGEELDEELVAILNKYMFDLHRFDFIAHRRIWTRKHEEFSLLLRSTDEEILVDLCDILEEMRDQFRAHWEYGYGPAKAVLMVQYLVNIFFTHPFIRVFGGLEDMLNVQMVDDSTHAKAINRLNDYIARIRYEFLRRKREKNEVEVSEEAV